MNTDKEAKPVHAAGPPTAHAGGSINKDIDLKSVNLKPLISQASKKIGKNAVFIAVMVVLLAYIIVVFRISGLAKAEPGPDQTVDNPLAIPTIDQNAINHIQSLEQNNTQIHTLFEQARNNPFQE